MFQANWWTRPCGGLEVMRLAVPLIISAGSLSLMTFTDRLFLMWFHRDTMTASMQAGLTFWMVVSLFHATAAYATAFVAQYHGCGHYERIGPVVWQGLYFSLFLAPLYIVGEPAIQALFDLFGHDPALARYERAYMHLLLWSAGAAIACESLASFFYGLEKMRVVMYVNIAMVLLNVVLDAGLIFGYCGLPRWGLEGAAIATVISQWVRLLLLFVLVLREDGWECKYNFRTGFALNLRLLGRMLYYGVASGVQVFADAAAFTVFVLLISSETFAANGLGKDAGNASSIAFTLNMFTFLPIVGTGIAVTTLVGNQIGHKRPNLAARAAITAFTIGTVYSAFFGVLFVTIPDTLLNTFAAYGEPGEFESIRELTKHLLLFVALYLFFDAVSIIFASALKGAGDTWFVMLFSTLLVPLLPILSLVGVYGFGFGIYWCWGVLTGWVLLFAVGMFFRFFGGKWKRMQVIERNMIERPLEKEDNP